MINHRAFHTRNVNVLFHSCRLQWPDTQFKLCPYFGCQLPTYVPTSYESSCKLFIHQTREYGSKDVWMVLEGDTQMARVTEGT